MARSTRTTAVAPVAAAPAAPAAKCFTDYVAAGDAAAKLARYKRQVQSFCALAGEAGVVLDPAECKIGGAYRSAFEAYCKDHPNG